eukprot:4532385-Amphidinium_carterae.1
MSRTSTTFVHHCDRCQSNSACECQSRKSSNGHLVYNSAHFTSSMASSWSSSSSSTPRPKETVSNEAARTDNLGHKRVLF